MKKISFKSLLASGMAVAALALSMGSEVSPMARASAPASSASSIGAAKAPTAPLSWVPAVDVSEPGSYDTLSSVAASALNGAVTIGYAASNLDNGSARLVQASNDHLGGPIGQDTLRAGAQKLLGGAQCAHDDQGFRHCVFWAYDGGDAVDYYSKIDPNGNTISTEEVPGSRGLGAKNTGIAVSPDGTVHALFGANGVNYFYFRRTVRGNWDVQAQRIPTYQSPQENSIGVTTQGTVIVVWKDNAPIGEANDILGTVRQNDGTFAAFEDITAPCCSGCPSSSHTYLPRLARDPFGGMRMSWAEEHCDPRPPAGSPSNRDIYYREWVPGTGWNGQPIVRIINDSGDSYHNGITVDQSGTAHIVWEDATGAPSNYLSILYAYGSGTHFTFGGAPFNDEFGDAYQKVPSIDSSPGYIHTTFESNKDDNLKDIYYSYSSVGTGGPTNTPTVTTTPTTIPSATPTTIPTATYTPIPSRCPGERFKDVCPGDPFYTEINALATQMVVTGYGTQPPCINSLNTPCFAPDLQITRGQVAKVIALAAHLPASLQGGPHFEDVPSDSTFYQYIEYSYNAGVIGGYACGGPGEPCDIQNRP
ncbi:MAG: S-layer homology domain-containing protein, partial [Chloroflexota bacterium]|nr:S-layer homology domain-containing protein [Chloroflexota bacterium]